jgi:hypothetical protein
MVGKVEFVPLIFLVLSVSISGSNSASSDLRLEAASSSLGTIQGHGTSSAHVPANPTPHYIGTNLVVTIKTDQKTYALGQPVHITIILTNSGKNSLILSFGSACYSSFRVEAADGTTIFAPFFVCAAVVTQLTINPGESLQVGVFVWNQETNLGSQVPRGVFVVRGLLQSTRLVPSDQQVTASGFSRIRIFSLDLNHHCNIEHQDLELAAGDFGCAHGEPHHSINDKVNGDGGINGVDFAHAMEKFGSIS